MKKILMMLLGVAFATCAWAATVGWSTPNGRLYNGNGANAVKITSGDAYLMFVTTTFTQDDLVAAFVDAKGDADATYTAMSGSGALAAGAGEIGASARVATTYSTYTMSANMDAYFVVFANDKMYISNTVTMRYNPVSQSASEVFADLTDNSKQTFDAADGFSAHGAGWYEAAAVPDQIEYLTWDEGAKAMVAATNTTCEVVTKDTATFEDKKWYVVKGTIERESSIIVTGSAHLILCDGAKLTVTGSDFQAGISVASGNSLAIYGQTEGTGALVAWGDMFCAGIGGSRKGSCGTITINGGKIKASGGAFGAGIGGGQACSSAATITINGGEIEAIGGQSSAGIGSGIYNGFSVSRSDTDLITINGGTIKATGGTYGAGIGSGDSGFAATVVINGGEITASTEDADAIGKGFEAKAATVTFGAEAELMIKAGADEESATTKTTTEFVKDHSATYVKIVPGPKVTLDEIIDGEDWTKFDVAYTLDKLEEGVDYKVLIEVTADGVTKSITNETDIVIGSFTNKIDTVELFGSKVVDEEAKVVLSLEVGGAVVSSTEKTVALLPPPGDIHSITRILSDYKSVYVAGDKVRFRVRLLARDYDTLNPTAYQLVYTGSGTEAEDKVSNPPMLGIVVSGQLRGAKIVEVKPAALEIDGGQTVNPYTDLICEYVVQPSDKAWPIKLAINGSTENNPIIPDGVDAVNRSGYILLNSDKWDIRIKGQSTSANLGFVSNDAQMDAYYFWKGYPFYRELDPGSQDYDLYGASFLVDAQDLIEYVTWDADAKALVTTNITSYTVVTAENAAETFNFEDGKWYVVTNTVERGQIVVWSGKEPAHLILCDGASLKVTGRDGWTGISVSEEGALTIYGQSEGTGTFIAIGGTGSGSGRPGIGGGGDACGKITINGGTVRAYGGPGSAGIGGEFSGGSGGTVTINGGTVEVYGGEDAPWTSGEHAAAIGAGQDSRGGHGTVKFGEGVELSVYAGDDEASAEEVTMENFEKNHSARFVAINRDPLVYLKWDDEKKELAEANSFVYEVVTKDTAKFEDGKWYAVTNTVECGSITVEGAAHLILCDDAELKVKGDSREAGIEVPTGKSLAIYGQSEGTGKLDATSGKGGAGIGGRYEGTCGTITINGASVTANGGYSAAGIGGGQYGSGGTVIINGGTVTANGGGAGAAIGGGYFGRGGTLTINGGKVTTIGGLGGAGIGGGYGADGGMITINGGTVTSNGGCGGGYSAAGIGGGCVDSEALSAGTVTFAEGAEFSIVAGADEASATRTTVADYTANHSAAYVKIGPGPKVTLDEIIDGEDWTKFDVAYTLDNLEEGVDYKVLIDVTAGGVTKTITNATDIVIGSFTNSVDTVKLFGSKVFDGEAKVVLSLEEDGEIVASSTEETVELLPPPVEYLDWNGTEFVAATNQAYEVVTADTATFKDGWYIVTNTIERAEIEVKGAAHLILCDGASLKVTGGATKAGIEVPADKSLTIYGQSEGTGKLEASSAVLGAGIGGSSQGSCGAITINGGTIKATGGAGGAGIGGGMAGTSAATITINGGEIEAIGGRSSAGIGSGAYNGFSVSRSDTDLITINGGTIKATGGQWGAGIGSGESGFAATVVINGGEITASAEYADAIGSGFNAKEAATVIFGTAMASKHVWAGASASNGGTMTTAAFATMHRMTYVELPVETYEVAYDANGAAGVMSNSVFAVAKEVTLKKNAFTALGYDFAGWATGVAATNAVVYADEAKDTDFATTNATLTLYAKWNASTNSVTATDFSSFTNMLTTAKNQGTNLGVTIGFDSGVKLDGATVTLPAGGTTGLEGLKYEDSTKMWLEDGVLYADKLRGDVTVDALQLMKLANGGTTPTSFKVITEGDGTSVTNDVIMLLGSDRQQYCNDEDDVAQMIDAVLAASPRPETVTLCDVKETIVSFTDFTDGKDGVYEVNEGETAKIAIAGGSKTSAVQATLYCVSKSSGAIKTTSSKVTTTAVNSSVINLLARINPAAALMMLQSSSTATTVVPDKPQIYVDGKRVNFPINLKWEKGDTEPKIVEIVTAANKAVKPDRYVRLQLGAPVGCKIVTGSDYAQLTIKDGGPDLRREVTASIYPAHAGKVAGAGFLKNEKSVITLTAKPAACSKTATFKGWFKAAEGKPTDVDFEKTPVSTELKFKVGFEDAGHYVAYFEEVLPLPQAVEPEVFKDGQIVEGVEGVVPADKDNSMLMLLVGAKVSLPISFSEETTGVTSVTAKGLPNGLKVAFDKKTGTCVITGKPTKRGTFFTTLTIKNAAGSSTLSLTFAVNSLAGRAVGLGRATDGMPMPNSNIDMTIGSSGSVSAKVNLAGVYNFSFSAKNLNYTCDNELNPIITIDLMNSKLEQELKLTWNSDEAAFEGEFMGSKFKAILLDSGSKTVATYTDKIFDSDKTQIGTIKVVVKESGLATITGKIDGNSFSTFGYAEEIDDEAYSYMTEFYAGSEKYYFFSEYVELYDEGECQILGRAAYQSDEVNDDDIRFGKPSSRPE